MVTPQDVWDFAYSHAYMDRHDYIQSLPEDEQECVAALFHYFDLVFRLHVENSIRLSKLYGIDINIDAVRGRAYKLSNPSNSVPWSKKYDPERLTW